MKYLLIIVIFCFSCQKTNRNIILDEHNKCDFNSDTIISRILNCPNIRQFYITMGSEQDNSDSVFAMADKYGVNYSSLSGYYGEDGWKNGGKELITIYIDNEQ